MGGLGCGAPLCATCQHSESGHVTKAFADKAHAARKAEETATVASRTSGEQRMHPALGVPLNSFEFLKADTTGYAPATVYHAELKHGLMGYFPAIFSGTKRIVYTTDIALMRRVWELLPRRDAVLRSLVAHVNPERGIGYFFPSEQALQEESGPLQLLTEKEFDEIVELPSVPFDWSRGLMGGGQLSAAAHMAGFDQQADKMQVLVS